MTDVERDRAEFRAAVASTKRAVRDADQAETRAEAAEAEEIAARWGERGQLRELLEPVLREAEASVRLAAASALLRNGDSELAIPVLDELRAASGSVADDAELLVESWRQERQRRGD